MSVCTMPMLAANAAVVPPMTPTTASAVGAYSKMGDSRHTMNTPAVTIVAAWIRAETGVGPSMASGSQVWSGTWADLANAPTSNSRHPATRSVWLWVNTCGISAKVWVKPTVWVWRKMKNVPSTRPTSPSTLMTNALMPALVAVVRRYQNEMSMYDAAPTNAQPMIRMMKLPARTSSSIENTK